MLETMGGAVEGGFESGVVLEAEGGAEDEGGWGKGGHCWVFGWSYGVNRYLITKQYFSTHVFTPSEPFSPPTSTPPETVCPPELHVPHSASTV